VDQPTTKRKDNHPTAHTPTRNHGSILIEITAEQGPIIKAKLVLHRFTIKSIL